MNPALNKPMHSLGHPGIKPTTVRKERFYGGQSNNFEGINEFADRNTSLFPSKLLYFWNFSLTSNFLAYIFRDQVHHKYLF